MTKERVTYSIRTKDIGAVVALRISISCLKLGSRDPVYSMPTGQV